MPEQLWSVFITPGCKHLYPFNDWLRFSPDAATDETRVELVYPTNYGYGITKALLFYGPLQRCRSDRWLEVL